MSPSKPTVYMRELLLTLWCRQKAILELLERKGYLEEKEFAQALDLALRKILENRKRSY